MTGVIVIVIVAVLGFLFWLSRRPDPKYLGKITETPSDPREHHL